MRLHRDEIINNLNAKKASGFILMSGEIFKQFSRKGVAKFKNCRLQIKPYAQHI